MYIIKLCVCVDKLAITTTVVSLNIILAVKAHHYCVVFAHKSPHTLILVVYSTSGCVLWLETLSDEDSHVLICMHEDSVMSIIAMHVHDMHVCIPVMIPYIELYCAWAQHLHSMVHI